MPTGHVQSAAKGAQYSAIYDWHSWVDEQIYIGEKWAGLAV
jgi:hypothetical protein